ncbi:MAG: AAA domain-containing protein [Desulfobacterales bacterium]|nr:AAA domain-containing protein [Desulfobacterales bacterium]
MSQCYKYHIVLTDEGKKIRVNVRYPDGKEKNPEGSCRLSEIPAHISELASKTQRGKSTQAEMDELGEALFDSLFSKEIATDFRSLLAQISDEEIDGPEEASQDDIFLRLELDLDEGELPAVAALPWEFLRAPQTAGREGNNLGTHSRMTLSRRRNLWKYIKPVTRKKPLRIQLVVSNPDDDKLGTVVYEEIEAALQKLAEDHPNQIASPLKTLFKPSLPIINQALEDNKPDILHFIGHGRLRRNAKGIGFGELALTGAGNTAEWCSARQFGELFEEHNPSVVILQACESAAEGLSEAFVGAASQVVHRNIPVVVAMQYPIDNNAAVVFAEEFYRRIGQFKPVDVAVQKGRRLLKQKFGNTRNFAIPVLFMRVEDGQLFIQTEQEQKEDVSAPQPEVGQEKIEVPLSESFQPFSDNLVNTYPLPVAQACTEFNQANELGRRFVAFDRLINHLIKYLAAIFIGQARRDIPPDYPLPDRLEWMARPTLENWAETALELSRIYQKSPWCDKWKLAGLLNECTRSLSEKQQFTDALKYLSVQLNCPYPATPSVVEFLKFLAEFCVREWDAGAAHYSLEEIPSILSILQPALTIVLEELKSVREYPLIYVERADVAGDDLHLRLVRFMGRFTDDLTPSHKTPIIVSQANAQHIKRHRLYVANSDGMPQLDMHPFFVLYRWEMYQLEYRVKGFVEFTSCTRGTRFRPPVEAESYMASWWEDPDQAEPAEIVPPVLGKDENWPDQIDLIPSDESLESVPLTWLNTEGRNALEISLGESLRIGHFWLGIEFLFMGLSKQEQRSFPMLLREMGIHPGEFRGLIRGVVGVVTEQDWRKQDVAVLGAEALPDIRVTDPEQLRRNFQPGKEQSPIITPRMMNILQDAVTLAGEGQVGHNHLIGATLRHPQCLAMQLLFLQASKAGWSSGEVLARLANLIGIKSDLMGKYPVDLPPRQVQPLNHQRRSILSRFGRDLTQAAYDGKLHQAEGESARQAMAQIGRILLQREANNPILVGEPGVGKTAIAEGFAWRLAGQDVVEKLAGRRVVELSANTLTAGTKYRGDLEERLQQVLAEVKAADGQVIVFIDEIHSILGGGASGGLSAIADAFKPALSRGEFPCIGATTVNEYRRHIEKDSALARRFTPVWIDEPGIEESIQVVKKVAEEHLAQHHGVAFMPEAVEATVKLSARYLHDERLPGKAVKVLDQACSGIIIGGSLSGQSGDSQKMAGGVVTPEAVIEVIADRTNIPVEQISKTEKQRLLELESRLKKRIIGQDDVVGQVVRIIKRAGAGLADPRRPLGVFLFAGPTGVGKTELALALAEALFDREDTLLRLDMSEFMEKHQVARLTGAPPGYVGYDEEGQLTGHLRRRPYSVVLLDEIEKAHKDVQHIFLQVFDNGRITDARGRMADGRNAIFIMTTNLGAKEALGFANALKSYREKLKASIDEHFTMEFINRIDRVVYFSMLDEDALVAIFDREFAIYQDRLRVEKGLEVTVTYEVKQQIVQHVARQLLGARPLRRLVEDQIVSPVVDKLLGGEYKSGDRVTIDQIDIGIDKQQTPPPHFDLPKPKRPASPEEGLPHLDDVDKDIQAPFDERFLALSRKLQEKGITFEITRVAKNFLCTSNNQGDRSPKQAFEYLIETPITDKLLTEEFQAGDWIRVDKRFDEIVFEKMGNECPKER